MIDRFIEPGRRGGPDISTVSVEEIKENVKRRLAHTADSLSARAQSVEEEIDRHVRGQIADSCAGVQRLSPARAKPERVVPPFPQRAYDRMRSGEAPIVEDFWIS